MAAQHSQQSRRPWMYWLIGGLISLVVGVWVLLKLRNDPTRVIKRTFRRAGLSDKLAGWWTAIAKHETAGFTSRVYKDGNNLFGMKLPRGETLAIGQLPYGERQAIFRSIEDSAKDQVLFLTKRFHYPPDFTSLLDLIVYMKERGYFEDDLNNYFNAVKKWT